MKTGKSSGFRDAWTVGAFGPDVLAVWTGNFDRRESPDLVGTENAAPLFFEIARAIAQKENLQDVIGPALEKLIVTRIAICEQTGAPHACGGERKGWFIPGKSPITGENIHNKQPEILSPREGLSYLISRQTSDPLRIPLEAKNAQDGVIYWFADNELIDTGHGSDAIFWTPKPGTHMLRFVDAQGRSASQ